MADRKTEHLRKLIAQYAMRAGEELNRGLPTIVREAYADGGWKNEHKPNGEPYESFADWLTMPPPPGCGLGCTPDAITIDDLRIICEAKAPDVAMILGKESKRNGKGRPKNNTTRVVLNGSKNDSNLRSSLSVRLAQEHPNFYQGYLDGRYRSVRHAAEAAGLVKPGHDPLARLKNYWRKASKAQRKAFLDFIAETP